MNIQHGDTDVVKVISTDLVNNTMVVDGGTWDTSNQSQVWSDNVTAPDLNRGTFANLFDGDLSTAAGRDQGSTSPTPQEGWTLTFDNSITNVKKVEIKPYKLEGSARYCEYQVNSESIVQQTSEDWLTLYDNDSAPITVNSIFCRQTKDASATWRAIKIDGKLLVDAVNDSQVWSDNVSGDIRSDRPPAAAFDGNPDTWANAVTPNSDETTEIVFNFNPPIPSGALEIYAAGELRYTTTAYRGGLTVNGTDRTLAVLGEDPNNGSSVSIPKDWFTVTSADGGDISSVGVIQARTGNTFDGISAYQFKANGKLLIDTGVRNPGDSEVTYGPVTGTGIFQVADQLNNTMTIQNSNDRWIDTSNRLGIEYYVRDNITVLNADNPKHVAMQQAIADAFDAFPQKVNERRTAIASSFYRLMEGETLSAADYSVLEETVLGAVNATEPFALDGYYPLYYTAAKANAASSTDSNHSHTINGVTYYMPDSGTLYHGNYLAPETTTTPAPTPTPTPTPEPTPEPTPDFDSDDSSY